MIIQRSEVEVKKGIEGEIVLKEDKEEVRIEEIEDGEELKKELRVGREGESE